MNVWYDFNAASRWKPYLGGGLGFIRVNGCLVCPFHGFEYDATGQGDLEYDPQVPAQAVADALAETTENSVDDGHLRYVHGYNSVNRIGSIEVDGAYLKGSFDFRRTQTIAGIKVYVYDVSAVTHVYGLGYSYVEVHEHGIGMDTRLWVLATPIDGNVVEMVLVSQVKRIRKPKRPIIGMRFLPSGLRTWLMSKIIIAAQKRDVLMDVVIWGRKHCAPSPPVRLGRGDWSISALLRAILSGSGLSSDGRGDA